MADTVKADAPSGKLWGPQPISPACFAVLDNFLQVAVKNGMVEREDAEKTLKILKMNPATQLCKLGRRLGQIQAAVSKLAEAKEWCEALVEQGEYEIKEVKKVAEWNPNWDIPKADS